MGQFIWVVEEGGDAFVDPNNLPRVLDITQGADQDIPAVILIDDPRPGAEPSPRA